MKPGNANILVLLLILYLSNIIPVKARDKIETVP